MQVRGEGEEVRERCSRTQSSLRSILCVVRKACCYNHAKSASISDGCGKSAIREQQTQERLILKHQANAIGVKDSIARSNVVKGSGLAIKKVVRGS